MMLTLRKSDSIDYVYVNSNSVVIAYKSILPATKKKVITLCLSDHSEWELENSQENCNLLGIGLG